MKTIILALILSVTSLPTLAGDRSPLERLNDGAYVGAAILCAGTGYLDQDSVPIPTPADLADKWFLDGLILAMIESVDFEMVDGDLWSFCDAFLKFPD